MGELLPNSFTSSAGKLPGINGVQIGPGATQFTRIPFSPHSCARVAVKFCIAPLVIVYGTSVGRGVYAFTELVLITALPGFKCGSAALHTQNIAYRFVLNVKSHSSVVISCSDLCSIWYAALFTTMSI